MRHLIALLTLFCFSASTFAADFPVPKPKWERPPMQVIKPERPAPKRITTEGKIIAIAGAGLCAAGIALAATSRYTYLTQTVIVPPLAVQQSFDRVNNGKRYGGIALAAGGGALIVYGLTRKK